MESVIQYFVEMGSANPDGSLIHPYGTTIQALGVTVGGLVGVFATLGIFFLVIQISDKISKKGGAGED